MLIDSYTGQPSFYQIVKMPSVPTGTSAIFVDGNSSLAKKRNLKENITSKLGAIKNVICQVFVC
jgi:hypothetical protein